MFSGFAYFGITASKSKTIVFILRLASAGRICYNAFNEIKKEESACVSLSVTISLCS